jgi:tetratricopeptide (TPR) repeat protein
MSPKKPSADRAKRLSQALELYEKGLKALGRKDHEKAQAFFEDLLAKYADETDVAERARVYLAVCTRAGDQKTSVRLKSAADFVAWGVMLHNQGDYAEAIKQFRLATEEEPKNEHALYCLAASSARAGEADAALSALRDAIALSPESRAQARSDSDFEPLRDEDAFLDLIYG